MLNTYVDRAPIPVQRVIRAGSHTFGRWTVHRRMLPGFLLCGGQHCGSAALRHALARHPEILDVRRGEEVNYFDNGYHHGIDWYRAHFPLWPGTLRPGGDGRTVRSFESSSSYLYHPLAAERFARDLPGVKLVVMVRDPVTRAAAQHAAEVAAGREPFTEFADAWHAAPPVPAERPQHAYRVHGQYADHLDRIAAIVPRDRILVVDSGAFFADPEPVFHRVLRFLGLPADRRPRLPRQRLSPQPPVPRALHRELDEYYAPFDERLVDWLGDKPSWRVT